MNFIPVKTLGPKRDVGQQYERKAFDYLITKGLKPVTQNFNCKTGEIDLIMLDAKMIVFVEVRYRKSSKFMSAAETISFSFLVNTASASDEEFDTHNEAVAFLNRLKKLTRLTRVLWWFVTLGQTKNYRCF